MTESYENNNQEVLNVGDELKVTVLKLEEKQVVVDTGTKYDGIIPISELSHLHVDHTNEVLAEGDEVTVIVKRLEDDMIILSKKLKDRETAFNTLKDHFENGTVFEVNVIEAVKGGLVVDTGLSAFMPASHVSTQYIEDLSEYKGKPLDVKIIEIDEEKNRIIVSRRAVEEEKINEEKQKTLQTIEPGDVLDGIVRRIAPFGVFVDIGGVDGLVHISQLSHTHVENASDVVSEGEEIKVKVLNVDRDTERIGLSLKETLPGPWDEIDQQIKVGEVIEGTVMRLVDFGAFVEIRPGIEGLVHISQISNEHIARPQEVLEEGQKVNVKVLEINPQAKRVSLSIKEVEKDQQQQEMKQYQSQEEHTFQLGDLIGDQLKKMKD